MYFGFQCICTIVYTERRLFCRIYLLYRTRWFCIYHSIVVGCIKYHHIDDVHYQERYCIHELNLFVYIKYFALREVLYMHTAQWPKCFIYMCLCTKHRVNITIFSVQWCFWMKPYVYFGAAVNIYRNKICLKRNIEYSMQSASIALESNVIFEYFITSWDTHETYLIFTRDLLFIWNSHKHLFF